MAKVKRVIFIGDTDYNADWIKTPENRASEKKLHAALAKNNRAKKKEN